MNKSVRRVAFPYITQDSMATNEITEDTFTNNAESVSSSSKMQSQKNESQFNDKSSR